MPRRIDVELTSARDDGTWTWRAAGARQPKGVVASGLLYAGAKVGDVLTAEADFDVDGITITSVTPPKAKAGRSGLLEATRGDEDFQPVITNWKERAGGRDRDPYGERSGGVAGGRDGGRGGPGGGGGAGGRGGDRGGNRGGPRPTADWRAKVAPPAPAGGAEREPRGDRGGRGGRDRGERGDRGGRPRQDAALGTGGPTADRRGGQRPAREGGGATRRDRPDRGPGREGGGEGVGKPRPKRLNPANTHRAAVLESLSPEQRPVAEQVLRGGIPAVRRALEEQNNTAKAAGQPEIKPGPLVALAEELLPKLKTAEWRDRAEAAMTDVDEIGLRDLRSVVSGADAAARDDETRTLAASLREALERRVKKQQDDWIAEIASALDDNRLVRALRVASRPPDPSMRFPSDLALRLSGTASEAMAADTPHDRWAALLEAVAASPVRTTVKPAALPENPGEALLNAARQQAGRIPALTTLLGISMPPPPGPVRRIPPKPTQGGRGGGAGPRPPQQPRPPQAPAPEVSAAPAPIVNETTEQSPAPPTPVNDDPPGDIPTPPEATDPVAPAEPSAAPAADGVEAPSDASVTVDGSGPGAGES
ncbi:MAG TPA: hypothetical protein VM143_07530 [Acidimicrobiales bacterium]|nr:hypothetical protein [Acidimicrobiales bacterium]